MELEVDLATLELYIVQLLHDEVSVLVARELDDGVAGRLALVVAYDHDLDCAHLVLLEELFKSVFGHREAQVRPRHLVATGLHWPCSLEARVGPRSLVRRR